MKYRYVERMEEIFSADAREELDRLLAGDGPRPAADVYERLYVAMEVRNTYYGEKHKSVADFLRHGGYSEEQIARFRAMRKEEENARP